MSIRIDLDSAEGEVVGSTVAATARGKKIILKQAGPTGLYSLVFKDGGKLPKCLSGRFTHANQAIAAACSYVLRMKSKKDPEINQKD